MIKTASGPLKTEQAASLRRLAAIVLLAGAFGGCSLPIADLPGIGVPSNAPARPQTVGAYPAVHDVPAPREQAVLEPEERARIEKELIAARERQARAAGAADTSDAPKGAKKKTPQTN
ncbi:MAG: hypothetical protein ACOY4O_19075 [Pseudomonadota bacterium]